MTPRVLAERYQLDEVLGQGGMAVVYRATDLRLGRTVAVKLLRDQFAADDEFVARFEREARAAAALSHPNIVAVFDVGADAGTRYIVMEHVPGEDLKSLIRREAPLRADRVVHFGRQLCLALDYAHRQGIVHRDVKPHNILVTPGGEIKVADFGIAVALGAPSLTQSGVVLGTVQYIAPEQALGESGAPASDMYSAGVVLFEMATGRLPFQAENPVAVARMHVDRQPPAPSSLNPQLPKTLDWVILRALAKDPPSRFGSAGEMARALQEHQSLGSERTTRVMLPGPAAHAPRSRPGGEAAAVSAVAPAPPRHVVSRPRHRETQSAWPLVLVSGFALAVALAFIPIGFAWLQGSAGQDLLGLLMPTPRPAAPPTNTVGTTAKPVIVATATPEHSATPTVGPTATVGLSPTTTHTPATPAPSVTPGATATATRQPTQPPVPSATLVRPTARPTSPPPASPTPAPQQLPLVLGMRLNDARTQLTRMGWQVQTKQVESRAPAGIVVEQSPQPGTLLPFGASVTLSVSKGD